MPWLSTERKSQLKALSEESILKFTLEETDRYGNRIYRLDTSKLKKDKIYIINSQAYRATLKVIEWLRDVTFRDHKNLYTIEEKLIGNNIKFYAFSTDKKYTDICKKTAEIFNFIFGNDSQTTTRNGERYFIPRSEQILTIHAKTSFEDKSFTSQESEFVKSFGKSFSHNTLD